MTRLSVSPSTNKRYKRSDRMTNVPRSPESTGCDQNLQNHEPGEIADIEEKPEQLVIWIKEKMKQTLGKDATTSWDKLCIYRVPHYLQENDKKSYFPQTVSLGPYHHGKKHLMPMEHHKWRALNMVMKRTKQQIEMYIDAMKELEEKSRACYEGVIDLSLTSDKFTLMLVLDGCFVLELFRGTVDGFTEIGYEPNDPVFAMRGLMHSIQRDMIMLENQLPLFVLNRLLGLQSDKPNQTGIVAKVAVRFFKPLMPTSEALTERDKLKLINWREELVDNGELHCLDVFHGSIFKILAKKEKKGIFRILAKKEKKSIFRILGKKKKKSIFTIRSSRTPDQTTRRCMSFRTMSLVDKKQQQLIHCVTELREAGVKFRRRKTNQFWDIGFSNGYLEIPKLLIHDGTKSLFSNLIAFENCHMGDNLPSQNITSYIVFMDNLINSSEDVSYLHHCDIIEHWLGSDSEVANLFNRLCKEVVFDPKDSYLSPISCEVNRHYSRKWNSLKATLRHKYFSNPWAYLSFIAAVTLLLFTFFQSFYAIYAYYNPSPKT